MMWLFRLLAWGIRIFLMGSSAIVMFLMAAVGVSHLVGGRLTAEQVANGTIATLNFVASGLIILYVEGWICWYRLRRGA